MKITLSAVAVLALGGAAHGGAVLWDQAPDPALGALVDQNFPDFADFSSYLMADVVVGAGGWGVDSVTTYYTNGGLTWAGITDALLTLTPKTGPLPDNAYDPGVSGTMVPVSVVETADGVEITASGLGLALASGDWWIGLTPMADFGTFGQEFHQDHGITVGDLTAFRNPGGAFGVGTDWTTTAALDPAYADMAITIRGTPAPGALALLGLAGIGLRRRRRC